jgi:transposase
LLPSVKKTLAPRGERVTLKVPLTKDHLSVIGAITPKGELSYSIHKTSITGWDVILFLTHLLKHFSNRLLIVWDGSPIHRKSEEVLLFLKQVGSWHLQTEFFPFYAPDLNPTEGLWHQLKDEELANIPCRNLEGLHLELRLAIMRVRSKPELVQELFGQPNLDISEFKKIKSL